MRIVASFPAAVLSLCLVGASLVASCAPLAAEAAALARTAKRTSSHDTARGVPTFDLATTCRGASEAMGGTPGTCRADENGARVEVAKGWSGYPAEERARCSEVASMPGFQSYVELLTCLELAAQVKATRTLSTQSR